MQTDEEIMDYMTASLGVLYHASATCAMGTVDDPKLVLNLHGNCFAPRTVNVFNL